ncbi:MAG: hypothetical protein AB7O52_19730 [Planctomycetota bacterium]
MYSHPEPERQPRPAIGAAPVVTALFVVLVASTGCQSTIGWAADRGRDALDIVSFEAGIGVGLHAEAHVTEWLRADSGLVWFGLERVGVNDGRAYHGGGYFALGLPLVLALRFTDPICVRPSPPPAGFYVLSSSYTQIGPYSSHVVDREGFFDKLPWKQGFHVGASGAVGLFSVGAGVDLFQAVDFALGWFGLDVMQDDQAPVTPSRPENSDSLPEPPTTDDASRDDSGPPRAGTTRPERSNE